MAHFLVLASNYETVKIALFEEERIVAADSLSKQAASKDIVVCLDRLLAQRQIKLTDLDFCAMNQGPGPFTTLRTVIATANGISFATKLPLVGVNELESLLKEYRDEHYPRTVVLLNAFNQDAYYSYWAENRIISDCANIDLLLQKVKNIYPSESVRFIGNGAALYRQKINDCFGDKAFIPDPLPESSSVEQIAHLALEKWQTESTRCTQIQPLYLKQFKSVG